jgi:Ca2+/Na+ antiporter
MTAPMHARTILLRSLLVAVLLIGTSATLRWLAPEYLSSTLARRLVQIMMGLFLVAIANALPKTLTPLMQLRCDPAAEQAMRRFTGWTLTLGGVGYALTWMIAPTGIAPVLAKSLLGGAVLLVIVRLARAKMRGQPRAA